MIYSRVNPLDRPHLNYSFVLMQKFPIILCGTYRHWIHYTSSYYRIDETVELRVWRLQHDQVPALRARHQVPQGQQVQDQAELGGSSSGITSFKSKQNLCPPPLGAMHALQYLFYASNNTSHLENYSSVHLNVKSSSRFDKNAIIPK